MANVLYLSYDGLLDPLGQSQVWQYLRRLTVEHDISLISYEKPENLADAEQIAAMRQACIKAGVRWYPLRYHKRPTAPATLYDIIRGIAVGLYLIMRRRIQIVHARSYVASVVALALKRLTGVKYIFDMRGFWADERVEGGLWSPDSRLYHVAKGFERRFLLAADVVVSLTEAAVKVMQEFDYLQGTTKRFEVIPTCADLALFSPRTTKISQAPFTLGYVGSVGVWYLFDEVLHAFVLLRQQIPDARLLIVNRGGHEQIRQAIENAGLPLNAVELVEAKHTEVPEYIGRMDAAAFFIKPVFSKTASAATKLAEFLGCGIPVLVNANVGDQAEIVWNADKPVGVVVNDFESQHLSLAIAELIKLANQEDIANRCRAVAEQRFSVDWGASRYSQIYQSLV